MTASARKASASVALVVGLEGVDADRELLRLGLCLGEDVGEGRGAVDVWLTRAQQVEVGAVDEEDSLSHVDLSYRYLLRLEALLCLHNEIA